MKIWIKGVLNTNPSLKTVYGRLSYTKRKELNQFLTTAKDCMSELKIKQNKTPNNCFNPAIWGINVLQNI
jgi:hypothetical protein